jgi:hypothetical protein
MSVQRIKISMNKKIAILKHQKREIAGLLQENKDEKVCLIDLLSNTRLT